MEMIELQAGAVQIDAMVIGEGLNITLQSFKNSCEKGKLPADASEALKRTRADIG